MKKSKREDSTSKNASACCGVDIQEENHDRG